MANYCVEINKKSFRNLCLSVVELSYKETIVNCPILWPELRYLHIYFYLLEYYQSYF